MTDSTVSSFNVMLEALGRNPLKAIQLASKVHDGINRRSYEVAGIACGVARVLIDDEKHRADFYDEEFFDNLNRFHPSKLLLHVFAYVYGALSGAVYNRASEHARALKKVCDNRKIDVADIPRHIADHGGFDGLLNEQEDHEDEEMNTEAASGEDGGGSRVAQRPAVQGPILTFDDDGLDEDDLIPNADEDDERVALPKRKVLKPVSDEPKLKRLPGEYLAGCVVIRFGAEDMTKIMKAFLDGREVTMTSAPRKTSPSHELYPGAGPFLEILGIGHDAA